MTIVARVFLFLQMITVFPLLAYILRTQLLYAIFGDIYPSFPHILCLNGILLAVCVLFAIFLPQVGTVARYIYLIYPFYLLFDSFLVFYSVIHLVHNQKLTGKQSLKIRDMSDLRLILFLTFFFVNFEKCNVSWTA